MTIKIAIGLFGEYSEWYKYNKYIGDLFAFSFEEHNDNSFIRKEIIDNLDIPSNSHQILYPSLLYLNCLSKCSQIIKTYEHENNIKYDVYIFAHFNDILLSVPSTYGKYVTSYGTYKKLELDKTFILIDSIQIISDYCIRKNGNPIINIYDMNASDRHFLLGKLFEHKVTDLQHFKQIVDTNIFLIPSVIYTSNQPFHYTNIRSVFSPNERLEQTCNQVKSIYRLNNSSAIVLEGSRIGLTDMKKLSEFAYIVLFAIDERGHFYSNIHTNKSSYELYVLKTMFNKIEADWIFKFGGRYHLQNSFNIQNFQKDKPVFKLIDKQFTYANTDIFECVIYSIPKTFKKQYMLIFENILKRTETTNEQVETLLLNYSTDFYQITSLNVIGKDAIESFNRLI